VKLKTKMIEIISKSTLGQGKVSSAEKEVGIK